MRPRALQQPRDRNEPDAAEDRRDRDRQPEVEDGSAENRRHAQARAARRLAAHTAPTAPPALDAERLADDPVLLAQVRRRVALARAGAPRTADVAERRPLWKRLLEPVADRAPGAHVLRLLLRPDDLLERRVGAQELPGR